MTLCLPIARKTAAIIIVLSGGAAVPIHDV